MKTAAVPDEAEASPASADAIQVSEIAKAPAARSVRFVWHLLGDTLATRA